MDFTKSQKQSDQNLRGPITNLFSYQKIKSYVLQSSSENNNDEKIYTVATSMRTEMLMTTDPEKDAKISNHAVNMLRDKDYIQFFRACGPNYVRSVRRAQEVTAVIQYEAANEYEAQAFADAIKIYVHGNRGSFKRNARRGTFESDEEDEENEANLNRFNMELGFNDEQIKNSLSIRFFAYGLGLNINGTQTLVAANIDEFNQIMKYAFDSMVKKSEDDQSLRGRLYSVEVVPWSDHASLLNMVDFVNNKIKAPTPRGMIENAKQGVLCSSPASRADDFGKCCKPQEILMVAQVDEMGNTVNKRKCEPLSYLSPVVMKDNLETNAEFIVWISEVAGDKVKKLSNLGQCVNALRALPERFDYYYLQTSNKADYDSSIDMKFTVKELKAALDPAANLGIIQMISDENDEFFEMYYQPCLSALYGIQRGMKRDTDPKYFMAQPWYNIEECAKASCLEPNMAWDRVNGSGCVNGLLRRNSEFSPIPMYSDTNCAKTYDLSDGVERCKYGYTPMANVVMQMDNCRNALPQGRDGRGRPVSLSMEYLLEYFCMPRVSLEEADSSKMDEVDNAWEICVSIMYYMRCHNHTNYLCD